MTDTRRCSRCHEVKSVDEFAPTHCYCKPCFAAYNRDRLAKRKAFQEQLKAMPLVPSDLRGVRPKKPKAPKPPKAKPKSITVTVQGKPKALNTRGSRKYIDLVKPAPPPPLEGAETVEQFLARGGQVEQVAIGKTGYKL